jgi:hypothetical protein
MIDGLWTAEFGSSAGSFGGGSAVFRDGKILGGDATYYYVGDYTVKENSLFATLKISPFIEGAESVFKTVGRDIILKLEGTFVDQGQIIAKGQADGIRQFSFGVKLTKRA